MNKTSIIRNVFKPRERQLNLHFTAAEELQLKTLFSLVQKASQTEWF